MYDILQTIHVLAAVVWVGGAVFHVFASGQLAGATPETSLWWAEIGERAGQRYYMPASILVLLAGIGMVLVGDLSWGEPVVSVGFGGIVVSAIIGAVFITRASEALVAELTSERPDAGRLASLGRRIRSLSLLDTAVLAIVIWVMVVRPG